MSIAPKQTWKPGGSEQSSYVHGEPAAVAKATKETKETVFVRSGAGARLREPVFEMIIADQSIRIEEK